MSLAALERAQLLSRASAPSEASTLAIHSRRQFVEQLLTLPAYKDPQLTTYFAESISLHFAEFEDLQDQAVDAVLDLCEDEHEKTRISGIKALARIGKVEPRWVKGNTGVLLQLLESPPSEVKHVRQALYDLLDVSAADVLSMMAEDCKGAEEETGASRRNVLDFLQSAKEKRAEILESGRNLEAEKVFAEGFYDVMGTTAIAETRQILGLLLPLSTVSGKNSTPHTTGKFAKALSRCLHSNSPVGLTTPLLRLWAELDKRNPRLDPRWTLYFLAEHGAAVVSLVADKDDKMAREVLLSPIRDISKLRKALDQRVSGDLDERKLLPAFAQTILDAALRFPNKPNVLEVALYPVYIAITANRSTRDAIRDSSLRRSLDDLQRRAHKRRQDARDDKEVELWRNIRDMAETLADRDLKPVNIRPTWNFEEMSTANGTTRDGPSGAQPRPDHGPESTVTKANGSSEPSTSNVGPPAATVVSASSSARGTAPKVSNASSLEAPTPLPPIRKVESSPLAAQTSTSTQTPSRIAKPETTPAATQTNKPNTTGLSILARAKQAASPVAPVIVGPSAGSAGLSIRARASQAATPLSEPAAEPVTSAQGLSIRSAASKSPVEPAARPLLSRLGNGDGKRAREPEDEASAPNIATPSSRGSLASRLGIPIDTAKRPRITSDAPDNTPARTISLLDRMSRDARSASAVSHASSPTTLSIRNRAGSGAVDQSQATAIGTSTTNDDDGVIIRKGRGFAPRQAEDIMMAPAEPVNRSKSGRELLGLL